MCVTAWVLRRCGTGFSAPKQYRPVPSNDCCWVNPHDAVPRRVLPPALLKYVAVRSIRGLPWLRLYLLTHYCPLFSHWQVSIAIITEKLLLARASRCAIPSSDVTNGGGPCRQEIIGNGVSWLFVRSSRSSKLALFPDAEKIPASYYGQA